jgi:hypothetical protein
MNNYTLVNVDTDSLSICKPDMSPFTDEEFKQYLVELNQQFPELIKWEDDGMYEVFIVLKAKNYVMVKKGGKKTIKGSALKVTTKEPAMRELINGVIDMIINIQDQTQLHCAITTHYHNLVKEAMDITDIKRWVKRVTISDKTLSSDRTNESKIRDAIVGTEYKEGDRVYMFFREDESLCLVENFDSNYDRDV